MIAEHFERARDPQAATWYLRAGRRAASVFALTEAGELLEKAHALAPSEDADLRFDVLVEREALMDRLGERDGQTAQIEEMRALEDRIDPARRVQLLTIRGHRVFVQSDYDETRRLAGEAVQAAKALGREDLRAEALLLQGKALTWAEDTDAARPCLDLAVASGREAGRPLVVGEGLRYLGMLAGNVGDYPTSLEMTGQAREVFARAGDTEMESAAIAQQATTLFNMARYAEAQAALEETLPIFRRAGHRYREAVALSNLASIAVVRGHFATTDSYATQAIEICRELGELEAIAVSSLVLAHSALFTGRFDVARACAEESMAIARTRGQPRARVRRPDPAGAHRDDLRRDRRRRRVRAARGGGGQARVLRPRPGLHAPQRSGTPCAGRSASTRRTSTSRWPTTCSTGCPWTP